MCAYYFTLGYSGSWDVNLCVQMFLWWSTSHTHQKTSESEWKRLPNNIKISRKVIYIKSNLSVFWRPVNQHSRVESNVAIALVRCFFAWNTRSHHHSIRLKNLMYTLQWPSVVVSILYTFENDSSALRSTNQTKSN